MKIGILTLPFNNNYGGFLQEYALMTILKRMGHDVWFIDLQTKTQRNLWNTHLAFFKKIIKKYILRKDIVYSIIPSKENRYNELNKIITWHYTRPFVDKYLCPKISPIYSSEELVYLTDKLQFDGFVSGSDQIWRPEYMGDFLTTAYFDFLRERKKKEKRLSYAASFGTDKWRYSSKQTKKCAQLIKEFDAVSVREKSGVSLCKKYLEVDAVHVLDPTMLLTKEDYIDLIEKAQIKTSTGDLFYYILDETDEKRQLTEQIAGQLSLTLFRMGRKNDLPNVEDRVMEPVEKWLRGFYDAKFVITDSFHGMVFSIIFNKPFIIYGNVKRGIERFNSLLNDLNLKNRLILNIQELNWFGELSDNIDWINVNNKIEEMKRDSLRFLDSALSEFNL
jgi:hypothetical protein